MATAPPIPVPIRRFADPDAVDTVELPGPCSCPSSPHDPHDTAVYRTQLGGGERQSIATAGSINGFGSYYDHEAAESQLIAVALRSWTLQNAKGEPMPITFDVVHRRLDAATRKALSDTINDAHQDQLRAEMAMLPKAPGARSPGSSRVNGSRRRSTRARK